MSSTTCQRFSLSEINKATNNFDAGMFLGHGGEGDVYLGNIYLPWKNELTPVAVKQLKANSTEFDNEINTVSKLHHPHLVSLLGYCDDSGHKILVYEYMQKGSLSDYIKKSSNIRLSWKQWLNICLGAARGLAHLHSETDLLPKGIIHRDVKPANILLDHDWVAKVSDFGMFKLSHAGQTDSAMQTALKGTSGYYAPEYVRSNQITRKIDVYAFGVVLFEVLCRQSPWMRGDDESYYVKDDEDLGVWALENVDLEIEEEISKDCLEVFADVIGSCLQQDSTKRPTMDVVVLDLENALRLQEQEDEAKKLQVSMEQFTGFRPKAPSTIAQETRGEHEHADSVVLDIGGAITKVGFSGNDSPGALFETGVDIDVHRWPVVERLINPLKDGTVLDWHEYEKLLRWSLNYRSEFNPEYKHPILLTEPTLRYSEYIRERLTQVMFEEFVVPAMYIALQPVLSHYANGHTTGIVVESGEGQSYSVPIYEGYALPHAITSLNFAGHGLSNHFMETLNFKSVHTYVENGETIVLETEQELMRGIKEKLAYIAIDYNQELLRTSKTEKVQYNLPDGKRIALGTERFQCPEALFNPSMVGMDEAQGIQHITYNSITMCDLEIRDQLFGIIVLSGGSTMLPGFANRMKKEIKSLAPRRSLVKIWAPENRMHGAWVGGSVMASLSTFSKMCISKEEYDEYGPSIVHKKCL